MGQIWLVIEINWDNMPTNLQAVILIIHPQYRKINGSRAVAWS